MFSRCLFTLTHQLKGMSAPPILNIKLSDCPAQTFQLNEPAAKGWRTLP